MGRNEAKRRISMDEFNAAMGGVESRRDADVLDEAPQAYKDVDAVIRAQSDLIEVVHTIKQVVCVKG
jgi:tRNA-splicing ligase RtcB